MNFKHTLLACLLAAAAIDQAGASLITSGTPDMNDVVDFDGYDGVGTTHITGRTLTSSLGETVAFLSTPTSSIGPVGSGGNPYYELGGNGIWDNTKRFVATDNAGTLQFTFTDAVQSVGAYFNYFVDPLKPLRGFTLSALDADGLVIETHTVSFNTPSGGAGVNEGFFFGIASGANDIKSLVVTDGYVALDDLRFTTAVPEPATVGLMLIGLAAVGAGAARRRRD